MKELKKLNSAGQLLWERAEGDLNKFASGCAGLLESFEFSVSSLEELESLIGKEELPKQHFEHNHFADYAVTMAREENCFLDLYVWQSRSTNYHSHHFCGAFKALGGEARQAKLEFVCEKDFDFMRVGKLSLKSTTDLKEGQVETILPGEGFIHKNHYVRRPGLTLCLRSNDLEEEDIYSYYYPGLAVKLQKLSPSKLRHLKLVEFMYENNSLSEKALKDFYLSLPEWARHELATSFTRLQLVIEGTDFYKSLEALAKKDATLKKDLIEMIESCHDHHPKKYQRDMMLLESSGWSKG